MKDNLNKLLQVRNLANGEAALYFYGEIVSSWWGAWSVAIASRVPSARPSITASTSAAVRRGGFILALVLKPSTASSVNVK